jgi:hypothetical protein
LDVQGDVEDLVGLGRDYELGFFRGEHGLVGAIIGTLIASSIVKIQP